MYYVDVRYVVPLGINIVKSHVGRPWEWDAFDIVGEPTWAKLWLYSFLLFLFPFVSVEILLTSSPHNAIRHIHLRVGDFSIILMLANFASLFLPQTLFWYAYLIMVLLSSCYIWILDLFVTILHWVQANHCRVPILDIIVTAAHDNHNELGAIARPRRVLEDARVANEDGEV
ncbi:hypothetical protein NMG60_11030200 [Bertholletia excelsa]